MSRYNLSIDTIINYDGWDIDCDNCCDCIKRAARDLHTSEMRIREMVVKRFGLKKDIDSGLVPDREIIGAIVLNNFYKKGFRYDSIDPGDGGGLFEWKKTTPTW